MSQQTQVKIDTKPLDSILKALKYIQYIVKIGILGNKNTRSDGGSNATIGAAHEFSTSKTSRRSFLRMPLETEFGKDLEKAGALTEKDVNEIIKKSSAEDFAKKLGVLGVATVLKAFDTGGFGTWDALKPMTLRIRARKNQGTQILVRANSHQLRDSIGFKVEKKK